MASAAVAGLRVPPPVVVVLGATGAGKSKLALELARRFGGEIISADAMQMYKGLDIVTNKVTREEMAAAKHHVIDFLDPLEKCTVVDFRNKALPIIEGLLKRNVMPIICGGTNYYIESLVWKVLIDQDLSGDTKRKLEDNQSEKGQFLDFNDTRSSEDLYARLKEVDPERSKELMPSQRRKIVRSLQVLSQTGRKHSDLLSEQRNQVGGGQFGGPLRYENTLVIWVQCEQETLDDRCDKRVDKMMERGMLKELDDYHAHYNSVRGAPADYTVGIFQSIGFKEFHRYLTMTGEEKQSDEGKEALSAGVKQMKVATRQYSRRQAKWMRGRFLSKWRATPPVYAVNSTKAEKWIENCLNPAVRILDSVLAGDSPQQSPLPLLERPNPVSNAKTLRCDVCDKDMKGEEQYKAHLAGKRHAVAQKRLKRLKTGDQYRGSHVQKPDRFSIVIERFDSGDKLAVLKRVKQISGLSLQEVKDGISVVKEGESVFDLRLSLSKGDAQNRAKELESCGLVIAIRPT